MFLLAQALDNRGPDRCVNDGQVLDAADEAARAPLETLSRTMRTGQQTSSGGTTFYSNSAYVVIKAASPDRDVDGRRAPLLLLLRREALRDAGSVAASAVGAAARLDRGLDDTFTDELEAWIQAGKAHAPRGFARGFNACWGRLRTIFRRRRSTT